MDDRIAIMASAMYRWLPVSANDDERCRQTRARNRHLHEVPCCVAGLLLMKPFAGAQWLAFKRLRIAANAGNVPTLMHATTCQLCALTSAFMAAGMTSRARRPESLFPAG